jgi:hypothetical protein
LDFLHAQFQPNPLVMNIIIYSNWVDSALIPIAAASSAIYILLVERALRSKIVPLGFEVKRDQLHDEL